MQNSPAPARPSPIAVTRDIRLSEVLAALSRALDLTEGQALGHSVRTCMIGMRIASELGLDEGTRTALYYGLLLKDAGCSSNAAKMSALFGADDRFVKPRMKLVDWHKRVRLAAHTAFTAGHGQSPAKRLSYFLGIARTPGMTREIIQIRCDRGAEIALGLGFPNATAELIRSLDEHWNGRGYPLGLRGTGIPLLARIANLAQVVDVYVREQGIAAGIQVARERSGHWFDPALVKIVASWKNDLAWWKELDDPELAQRVIGIEPTVVPRRLADEDLDMVARSFADIIDAKSPYTFRHSANVAGFAVGIGEQLGIEPQELRRLRRAGLLHDIGKLGVSNRILDKPGKLTPEERSEIERHPVYTWEILLRVPAFADFAWTAALHHEKLDGSGYPWKIDGRGLDRSARVLAVADMYEALVADRPYRAGMTPDDALGILRRECGAKLCRDAVGGLEALLAL
jgi:HD-GYP domain-containing protein (c-di-GMP phosphodiesterase class II)